MISLLQRVSEARVVIAGEVVGQIGPGLLVLLCAEPDDTEAVGEKMLGKLLKLRIFGDAAGKMNLSVQDIGGGLLIVSQFTLAADTKSGNRPGFTAAAPPALGEALYEAFVRSARAQHPLVQTGRFGADMKVHLVNDGPVTIPLRIEPPRSAAARVAAPQGD
ncbi:D-aminoacyl-tRNA deacylase [Hydrogenophaga sp.]|uniref:D-aminoacyl-tRNA deacylase n=1 Tax=Hydrogenophaga sp. TaxID=1904254 RepID=UPI002730E212|nr:D-aminoacyl-tRNA deacylase [Hydrogenophaga sp.]MDP2018518.1 D-aminoacyl-tRNA deacylase [Hydrogenophaga sp.]MDP3167323.1 D-aminoacyl-tRNA deacylase [Hydrogenophaga sp.]MDP3809695.1 D-aminoacyl-tRNA deacylase [Hydrogenophaga sp.]